jgi:PAS domain S-box-containing protein
MRIAPPARYVSELALVTVAYVVAGTIGLAVPFTSGNVSPVWPPAGIALAATLLAGYRVWPAIVIGAFVVNFLSPLPHLTAVGIALGNAAGPLAGAWLLKRIPGFHPALARLRDALGLVIIGALGGTAVSATIGIGSLYLTGVSAWSNPGSAWLMWWLGDAMGVLIIAPLVLTFTHLRSIHETQRRFEFAGLAFAAVLSCLLVFGKRLEFGVGHDVLALSVFPFVIWGAIRFEAAGAGTVTFLISAIALWETAHGSGAFVRGNALQNAALLQSFLTVIAVSGIVVAALGSERTALIREQAAGEARRQGEERYREIAETANEGIWMIGPDLRTCFANRRIAEMLGVTVDEMLGRPEFAFMFDEDIEQKKAELERQKRGISELIETRYRRKDGAELRARVSTTPSFRSDGRFEGALAMVSDITDQKRTEAERRDALERIVLLSRAVEQTADSVLIANKEGIIEYVNPAFEATTGYTREEAIGQTPRLLKSGHHDSAFYRKLWDEVLSGRPFRGTLKNRKKTGEIYWAEQTITPIKSDAGDLTHFVAVLKDVTELRRQQEQEVHLRLAHEVQQQFYKAAASVRGLDIAAAAHPARETGGDYFDFIEAPSGAVYVAIGDASGHGLGSAIVMALTRAYVRSFAALELEVGEILARVNSMLLSDLEDNRFVTLLLLRIDPGHQSLAYSSAGHVPGFVFNGEGAVEFTMGAAGPPLGLFPHSQYPCASVGLEPEQLVMLMTDGVTESRNSTEQEFGIERALLCVPESREYAACYIAEGICASARAFAGDEPQHDDITTVVVKVEGAGRPHRDVDETLLARTCEPFPDRRPRTSAIVAEA